MKRALHRLGLIFAQAFAVSLRMPENSAQEQFLLSLIWGGREVTGTAGLEPATNGLEVRYSIQLSYAP